MLNSILTHAFISPSTIDLILSSTKSFILSITVVILVNISLFFAKIPKKVKSVLFVAMLIVIFVTVFLIAQKFQTLKKLNSEESVYGSLSKYYWKDFIKENNIIEVPDSPYYWAYNFEELDQDLVKNYTKYINLDKAIESKEYRILTIHLNYKIKDSTKVCLWDFFKDPGNADYINAYLKKLNISKKDKILFVCYTGASSSRVSMIFNVHGYNTSYSNIIDSNFENIFFKYRNNKSNKDVYVNLLSFRKKENYALLLFDPAEPWALNIVELVNSIKDNITIIAVDGVSPFHHENNKLYVDESRILKKDKSIFNDKNLKVICIEEIHCFFTKHFLNYYNITSISNIYSLDYRNNQYNHFNAYSFYLKDYPDIIEKVYVMEWDEE